MAYSTPSTFKASHASIVMLLYLVEKCLHVIKASTSIDKIAYFQAMERSPIKDIEIKHILRNALTDKINDREIYMKGIDHSYYYEGYNIYKIEEL